MNTWVPVITADSFGAFVIGALVTATCFIVIVISWRAFKREDAPANQTAGLEEFWADVPAAADAAGFWDDEAVSTRTTEPGLPPPRPVEPAPGQRQARVGSHRAPHPLGEPTMAEGMPRPPGARRPPRHAAPSPRRSSKKSGVSATHSLPGGGHR